MRRPRAEGNREEDGLSILYLRCLCVVLHLVVNNAVMPFNSLFEMHAVSYDLMRPTAINTFNSLFEMLVS